ncbi:MAG TPA: 2-isopropylmalate synthase [Synergistaceae bacterium]|nr:2-isopropylmalate synthase [Synergistaceae bacterium]HQH78609.1 2-isopropylmalate synthase [Synergistaceae bacterium]HQK24731.1 2-isopropylmalate synthase [Synergistaceae bacterium]
MDDGMVRIFDTTLRDGEQAAGVSLSREEKLQIARQLAALRVNVIEAGFPAASPGDLDAVAAIAAEVRTSTVAGLARAHRGDIEAAGKALRHAALPRIHTFIATSDIHMTHKLRMSRERVLEEVRRAVSHARELVDDVEFSAEDASRSDPAFLAEVFRVAVSCGATTLNVPDTVGYADPGEFGALVRRLVDDVGAGPEVVWSVHCHDDLGLAVANSLAAVQMGARQVECTVNGLGERAGNASLEEVVMALRTRRDRFALGTRVDTPRLCAASHLVSRLTGVLVPPNKAVVGANAFAHESGIHQHGVMSFRGTYEVMTPEDVGAAGTKLVLGKHSGRHAFRQRVESLGYSLSEAQMDEAFGKFKELADRKESVSDGDLEALAVGETLDVAPQRRYTLDSYDVHAGTERAMASVTLREGDATYADAAAGNGPVDAAYAALRRILGLAPELVHYNVTATSEASDAVGEATLVLRLGDMMARGRGASTDVVASSIKAYVSAVNRLYELAAAKGVTLCETHVA